jgi:NADH:ubiquinone oxidoreductase subunit 6 (subunit J)
MPNLTDDTPQNHPYRALGWHFWLPWGAGIAATILGFIVLAYFAQRQLEQPLRTIVMSGAVIVLTLMLVFLNQLPHRAMQKRGLADPMRPAMRRYQWRFMIPMLLYIVALMAATWYWKAAHPTGVAALLTALAPAVPILFAIRAMAVWLHEESDEYLRAQMLKSWVLGALFAMAICTMVGFLDQFRVIPHIPLWAAFPLWAVCSGIVQARSGRLCT